MAVLDAELRAERRSFADLPRRRRATASRAASASASTRAIDALLGRRRRLPRRRLRAHQAEDRARLRPRAGRRGPRADRARRARCRSTPTPRTRADDAEHLARLDALRPAAHRAAAARGRPPRPRRAGPGDRHAGVPRRVDHVARPSAPTPSSSARPRSSTSRPGRVGGYLTARRIHDLCRERGDPGVVRRDAGDGHRPRRQRRARRARRVHAARRRLGVAAVLGRATSSPSRSTSSTATSPCPTGPGFGVELDRDVPRRGRRASARPDGSAGPRERAPTVHSGPMPHPFLSDEWMAEAKAIRARYAGQTAKVTQVLKINQVVTGVPFGDGTVESYLDTSSGDVVMDLGAPRRRRRHRDDRLRHGEGDLRRAGPGGRHAGVHDRQDHRAGRHDEADGDADGDADRRGVQQIAEEIKAITE